MQLSRICSAIYPSPLRQPVAYRQRFVNMVKPDEDVIREFNELVNMTADELEKWLKSKDSQESGWTNGAGGETVGHDSGNKITDILKRNPDKKKDKYTEDDIKHMRKVVSYNKRHLAQEEHLKETKSEEELKKTKSYKSLKNDSSISPSTSSTPAPGAASPATFRSDVAQPTALRTGKIGGGLSSASAAAAGADDGLGTSGQKASHEYLDRLEESVNKSIDSDIETLLESFKELISLATIGDKDKFQIEQEAFQADARADAMVRSAQNLSLLSESLKMSLLLSKTPDPALNDEAIALMKSTELEKLRCAELLERILGLPQGQGAVMVQDLEDDDGASPPHGPSGSGQEAVAAETMAPDAAELKAASSAPASQPGTAATAAGAGNAGATSQEPSSTGDNAADDDEEFEMEDVSMG